MNRSRYQLCDPACGAAYTATGIRTPELIPLALLLALLAFGVWAYCKRMDAIDEAER